MNRKFMMLTMIVALTAAGCFHNRPDYPASWPRQLITGNDIEASVQGTYECRGEAKTDNTSTVGTDISTFLFEEKELSRAAGCTSFSIARDKPGTLTISTIREGKEAGTRTLRTDKDYTIEGEWLNLKREGGFKSGDGIVGIGRGKNSFTTNAENDLIIRSEGTFMAIVLLVPVAGSDVIWVRFKRVGAVSHGQE